MIENPSADKFGPPPPHRDPMERTPLYKRWWFTPLVICAWIVHFWLRTQERHGWMALASVVFLVGLTILHHVWTTTRRDESVDSEVYSPPTRLTR